MSDIAIRVENLSKQYRLGQVGTGTISHDLNRWWHRVRGKDDPYLQVGQVNDRTQAGGEYVWAIEDINFEVPKGEILGVIGGNGAGKSTLLKILSKVTRPTKGRVLSNGRIASLLEVGTGFHLEMTGRENIYMNGTIMGMRRKEIDGKLEQIVEFAGVAKYLDTPVKRYSSGMIVRLGFAIAAHLEPDILIVDEVLAVGDMEFQKKAVGKMQDVSSEEGRTVLFVSHNMQSIKRLCKTGIVLEKGRVKMSDTIEKATNFYLSMNTGSSLTYVNEELRGVGFAEVKVHCEGEILYFSEDISITLKTQYEKKYRETVRIGIAVKHIDGRKVFTTINDFENYLSHNHEHKVTIPAQVLLSGDYCLDVAIYTPSGEFYEYVSDICHFSVVDIESALAKYARADIGSVFVNCTWE